MAESPTFKIRTVAAVLGVSPRRVQQLVKQGMPRASRGTYDLSACVQWYEKYRTGRAAQSSKLDQARLRKTLAEAKLAEIEVTAIEEKLIPADVVQDTWKKITETIRARLLKIPAEVAAELEGTEDQAGAQEIIKRSVYGALDDLSQIKPEDVKPLAKQ